MRVHVIKIKSEFQNGYLDVQRWDMIKLGKSVSMFEPEDITETRRIAKRYEDSFNSDFNLKCVVVEWTIKEKIIK